MTNEERAKFARGMELAERLAKARNVTLYGFKRLPDGSVEGICAGTPWRKSTQSGNPPPVDLKVNSRPKKVRRGAAQLPLL